MPRLLLPLALVVLAATARAQPSGADRLRGYAERGDGVVFVFAPALYGVTPDRVAVTGPFRAWSTDDADAAWALAPEGDVWTLRVEDPEAAGLGPSTPFKFRADGRWLDPPAEAANVAGGNLVYRYGEVAPRLVAEMRGPDRLWVAFEGVERSTDPAAYRVVRWDGREVGVGAVFPNEVSTALVVTGGPEPAAPFAPPRLGGPDRRMDADQVHYVEVDVPGRDRPLRALARFDGLWRDRGATGPLGAFTVDECPGCRAMRVRAALALFAPRADSVVVHFYRDRTGPAVADDRMVGGADGVWSWAGGRSYPGDWYDFSVYGPDGPGSAFTNHTGRRVTDPYALVSDDSWGRARIWADRFEPPQPVRGGRPAMEDVVAYEVHLQDATDRLPVPDGVGPLEAFAMPGLTNGRGEPVGIDHAARLGVNVVHLLPVQEYLHYPDDAWRAAFADDPFMQEQGIADENYQWGYRTTHALAIESRFRSAGDEPGRERERLRDLVDAFHARGIAVVVDVVFNHTGENMEGVEQSLTFNGIDKWYYYRLDAEGNHIGAFGNEVKSENRPMVQRWLLDQLRQLVEVFGVDGFRIDLAGQTDEQTLRWLRAELGEDVLLYGEPWIGSNDPDYEATPSWDWYKADSPITFFQDDARNAFKGSPLDDPTPAPASRGFAGGDAEAREAALAGLANAYPEEPTPSAGINYLDIHDNWALADRFAACQTGDCAWDGRAGVRAAEMRIAATLLMTSLGPVVMHGGTEIARSKGLAPLPDEIGGEWERTEMALAPIYIKGRGDTYNLRAANAFDWEAVGNREGPVDHAAMLDWWRGLIALRLSEAGAVFRVGEAVPEGWVSVHEHPDPRVLLYTVGERVHVRLNVGDEPAEFGPLDLPGDGWRVAAVAGESGVDISPTDLTARRVSGLGAGQSGTLGPKGVMILVRDE